MKLSRACHHGFVVGLAQRDGVISQQQSVAAQVRHTAARVAQSQRQAGCDPASARLCLLAGVPFVHPAAWALLDARPRSSIMERETSSRLGRGCLADLVPISSIRQGEAPPSRIPLTLPLEARHFGYNAEGSDTPIRCLLGECHTKQTIPDNTRRCPSCFSSNGLSEGSTLTCFYPARSTPRGWSVLPKGLPGPACTFPETTCNFSPSAVGAAVLIAG